MEKIFTFNLTVCSNRQIEGEDFVHFCGILRKHELYYQTVTSRDHQFRTSAISRQSPVRNVRTRFLEAG